MTYTVKTLHPVEGYMRHVYRDDILVAIFLDAEAYRKFEQSVIKKEKKPRGYIRIEKLGEDEIYVLRNEDGIYVISSMNPFHLLDKYKDEYSLEIHI